MTPPRVITLRGFDIAGFVAGGSIGTGGLALQDPSKDDCKYDRQEL